VWYYQNAAAVLLRPPRRRSSPSSLANAPVHIIIIIIIIIYIQSARACPTSRPPQCGRGRGPQLLRATRRTLSSQLYRINFITIHIDIFIVTRRWYDCILRARADLNILTERVLKICRKSLRASFLRRPRPYRYNNVSCVPLQIRAPTIE